MPKTQEELLAELNELGISKSGRKTRNDKGKTREPYIRSDKPRSDKGIPRKTYVQTPLYYKNLFQQFILHHSGERDDIERDVNLIFPVEIVNYYKKITKLDGTTYRSSVTRESHPEKLRWQWWMAELESAEDKTFWTNRIADWYFIKRDEIDAWTYIEWAWAYYQRIAGHLNRGNTQPNIVLSYDKYLAGEYGFPDMDAAGDVIWKR